MSLTFALIATVITSGYDSGWVLDDQLTLAQCEQALYDFGHSNIFVQSVVLTCEREG